MKYKKTEAKEWAKENLHGLGCGVITPLLRNGDIDYEGLKKVAERAIQCGSDVIICDGTIGEWVTFTTEERKKICTTVVEAVAGRKPVVFGPAHTSAREVLDMTKHAEKVGADAVMIMTPYMMSGTEQGIYEFYKYVADRVNIGMTLYNTLPAGFVLSPAFIKQLVDKITNICAIKEGTTSLPRLIDTFKAVGDKIAVGDPQEYYWPENLEFFGKRAFMFCAPQPYLFQTLKKKRLREYTDLWLKGDKEKAREIYWELMPLRKAFTEIFAPGFLRTPSTYPVACLKYAQELLGLPGGPVRPPILPASPEDKNKIKAAMVEVGLIKG